VDSRPLQVVCWKWQTPTAYRSKFTHDHVNTLYSMVARHYPDPFEMVCITDNVKGIRPEVRTIALWNDWRNVPSPHGGMHPSCYCRLRAFAGDMAILIGPRFVSVDLDCVITGDLRPIWNRPEDFVIWGDVLKGTPYNGSMWMMDAGARSKVFHDFDPLTSPKKTTDARLLGSDQAWISYVLGPSEKTWTAKDGVYAFRTHVRNHQYKLPPDARIVFFQGNIDPWSAQAHALAPWIKEHYR
jgi:hypothetical protein